MGIPFKFQEGRSFFSIKKNIFIKSAHQLGSYGV